jgi:hypothetical protein
MARPTRRARRAALTELGPRLGPTRAQDSLDALAVLAALALEQPVDLRPEVVFLSYPRSSHRVARPDTAESGGDRAVSVRRGSEPI